MFVSINSLTETTSLSKVLKVDAYRIGVILLIDDIDLNAEDNLLSKVGIYTFTFRNIVS